MATDAGDEISAFVLRITSDELRHATTLAGRDLVRGVAEIFQGQFLAAGDLSELGDEAFDVLYERDRFIQIMAHELTGEDAEEKARRIDEFMAQVVDLVKQTYPARCVLGQSPDGGSFIQIEIHAPDQEKAEAALNAAIADVSRAHEVVTQTFDPRLMKCMADIIEERNIPVYAVPETMLDGREQLTAGYLEMKKIDAAADAAAARLLAEDVVAVELTEDAAQKLTELDRRRRARKKEETGPSQRATGDNPGARAQERGVSDVDGSSWDRFCVTRPGEKPVPTAVVYLRARELSLLEKDLRMIGASTLAKTRKIDKSAGHIQPDIDSQKAAGERYAREQDAPQAHEHGDRGPQTR